MASTLSALHPGVNQSNRQLYKAVEGTNPADNANWTIQFPESDQVNLPLVKAVITYGAGAEGVRLATYYPIVDTGSALVGVEVVSYNENTGILTLTNRSGGALTTPTVILELARV